MLQPASSPVTLLDAALMPLPTAPVDNADQRVGATSLAVLSNATQGIPSDVACLMRMLISILQALQCNSALAQERQVWPLQALVLMSPPVNALRGSSGGWCTMSRALL